MTRRAYTLIETLLAISLIIALSAAVFTFLWQVMDRRQRIDEVGARSDGLSVLWNRLASDLATTYAQDPAGQPGISGDASHITVHARGVGLGAARAAERTGSEFTFDPIRGQLAGRDLTAASQPAETLCEGLERVRFRYHDGTEWKDAFDSAQARALPLAVEVSVWIGSPLAASPDSESLDAESADEAPPLRAPDRTRIFTVPDGPMTAWKGGQ